LHYIQTGYWEHSNYEQSLPRRSPAGCLCVVAFPDPDGYRLDFESPTDVPEETIFSAWFK